MNQDAPSKRIPLGLTLAGGALLTILPLDLSVSKSSPISFNWHSACAMAMTNNTATLQNGSCAPRLAWVCGLNGQNYTNKYLVC